MPSNDKPDTASDPTAPNEQTYRGERGGTDGVGAFRRNERDAPFEGAADAGPEREGRNEPAFGWDPQTSDGTPRDDAEYRRLLAGGDINEPGGTSPVTRDNDLGPGSAPESLLHPQPWGIRPSDYAPTQGPLGPEDFEPHDNWPEKDSFGD